jgi:diaminohydroxyphosphoribosylaminopyrimidine deaminase/5-amino-6-(5-phosphoribosylamino)uracil reductase
MHDSEYLIQALDLARPRQGFTAPNPAVGAIAVQAGKVISRGTHWASGHPHAEVEALRAVSPQTAGVTLYVTLEPCCHWGKTPPCTRLLIERGVQRVVYAYRDPNPKVSGKGEAELREAGIECQHLPLAEIDTFYAPYRHWVETGLPWVTAKLALSFDGKIAGPEGVPQKLSGPELDSFTHRCRQKSDAILTTVKTIQRDDPQLNVRLSASPQSKPIYVLDRLATLSTTKRIFDSATRIEIFCDAGAPKENLNRLAVHNVRCRPIASTDQGLDPRAVLSEIGKDGVHALWIEAGGRLFESLADAGLLQNAYLYVCPRWLGEKAVAAFREPQPGWLSKAKDIRWQEFGRDSLCELIW